MEVSTVEMMPHRDGSSERREQLLEFNDKIKLSTFSIRKELSDDDQVQDVEGAGAAGAGAGEYLLSNNELQAMFYDRLIPKLIASKRLQPAHVLDERGEYTWVYQAWVIPADF